MKILAHIHDRTFHRLAALLATGTMLLGPAPSRAHDERLAMVMPSHPETTGTASLDPNDRFAPAGETMGSTTSAKESVPATVKVRLERIDNHETMTLDLPRDGLLAPEDVKPVAHFFRCRRTGRQRPINAGVLAMLADVAAHWPDQTIEIVSGFRAPPYGAPHSKHFKGQAIDLRIPGVRTTELRNHIWRQNHSVGVGYYKKENFVHMDWRPGAMDRAWTGSEEGGTVLLNPRWARRARRSLPAPGAAPEPVPYALSHSTAARTL